MEASQCSVEEVQLSNKRSLGKATGLAAGTKISIQIGDSNIEATLRRNNDGKPYVVHDRIRYFLLELTLGEFVIEKKRALYRPPKGKDTQ